jgi:hypothetical protein
VATKITLKRYRKLDFLFFFLGDLRRLFPSAHFFKSETFIQKEYKNAEAEKGMKIQDMKRPKTSQDPYKSQGKTRQY